MSNPAKTIVLRAILPNDPSVNLVLAREAPHIESDTLTLSSEKMTTEVIVDRIKELSKLRDEIIQVTRQLSISREPGAVQPDEPGYHAELESIRQEIEDTRGQYQEVQAKIDRVQRQIDDSKNLVSSLTELSKTGFTPEQLETEVSGFHRVLGRIPVKKLEAAQKAVQVQLKDQAILAIGSKGKDSAYILVAAPSDKSSQTLQTLLLYDFSQIEIPEVNENAPRTEIQGKEDEIKRLTAELEEKRNQQADIRKAAGYILNRRLDEISDSLILLRGTLKLGEGAQASRIYTRLEKPLPVPIMTELTKKGVIEVETLS